MAPGYTMLGTYRTGQEQIMVRDFKSLSTYYNIQLLSSIKSKQAFATFSAQYASNVEHLILSQIYQILNFLVLSVEYLPSAFDVTNF